MIKRIGYGIEYIALVAIVIGVWQAYPMGEQTLDDEAFAKLKQFEFNHISTQLEDIGWQKGAGI